MTTATEDLTAHREPALLGQTVVIIGGSAGIGLETARLARREGADVVLAARNPERLEAAARELEPRATATFDATDAAALGRFFADLSDPIHHVMSTAGGPSYAPLLEMTGDELRDALSEHPVHALEIARNVNGRIRPGGSLVLVGGTGGRRISVELGSASAATAVMPTFTASLALALAPVRVNLVAPGFVDTPLSARILGDELDARRDELRRRLPIGRVVGPEDVAALAVHLMVNTAVTGATYDVDGGQQFVF
jgi:NAD(P)-dependent dehydrogenase (short-subunit alcohol dehydrogenase family)